MSGPHSLDSKWHGDFLQPSATACRSCNYSLLSGIQAPLSGSLTAVGTDLLQNCAWSSAHGVPPCVCSGSWAVPMNISSHPSAPRGRVNSQWATKGRQRQWEDFKAAGFSGGKHTIQPNDFLPLCMLLYITQISGLSEQTSEMGEGWQGKKPSKTALCFSGMETFSSIRFPRYLNNGLQWPIKPEEKISQYNSTQRIYSFSYMLHFSPFCLNFYYWNWWYVHWMSWGWKAQPLLEKRSSFQGPQTTNHFFFF